MQCPTTGSLPPASGTLNCPVPTNLCSRNFFSKQRPFFFVKLECELESGMKSVPFSGSKFNRKHPVMVLGTSKKIWQFSPRWGHLCFQSWSSIIPNVVGAPTDIHGWNTIEHNHTNSPPNTCTSGFSAGKQLPCTRPCGGKLRTACSTNQGTHLGFGAGLPTAKAKNRLRRRRSERIVEVED